MSFFGYAEDYRPDDAKSSRAADLITRSDPQTTPQTIGFDKSIAGYSLASCSPAELGFASRADRDSESEVECLRGRKSIDGKCQLQDVSTEGSPHPLMAKFGVSLI